MPTAETIEQINSAKQKQRNIIITCNKAIADIQANILVLQTALSNQNRAKQQAQDIINSLNTDFPDAVNPLPIGVK